VVINLGSRNRSLFRVTRACPSFVQKKDQTNIEVNLVIYVNRKQENLA